MAQKLKFNPGFQTDDEAVANFVVRRYEFETVIDELTNATQTRERSVHLLVVAPRGAGKTTLCRRVLAEIHQSAILKGAWQPIFLGEENYAVTTAGEFFLECMFQLSEQNPSAELRASLARASHAGAEQDLLRLSLEALRSYCHSKQTRLLIIVENFHIILNQQIQELPGSGRQVLIDALADAAHFGVLATSVVEPSDGDAYSLPRNYLPIALKPLSLSECRDLWEALTSTAVVEEKLRPLEILTGGSPRMIHILADFMRTPSLHHLMTNLNYLIDQNTEYFKSQLDSLPPVERKVFATLLDLWAPSTAKQVADQARVTTNIASAMLGRLVDRGAVVKEQGQGRTSIYYAAERLFNIYYLMRRRSHPSNRVRALVTFMIGYYDGDELVDTAALLMREACTMDPARRGDYHSTFDAIMASSTPAVRDQILARIPPEFIRSFRAAQRVAREQTSYLPKDPSSAIGNPSIRDLVDRIEQAADKGDLDAAYDLITQGLATSPEIPELWLRLSFLEQYRANAQEAVAAAEKAVALEPSDSWSHAVLGRALASAGRLQEAEASYAKAIGFDPGQSLALIELAGAYERRGEVSSAVELFTSADRAGSLSDYARSIYGKLLDRIGRPEEAERVLRVASSEYDNTFSRRALSEHLAARGRAEEGAELLRSVAQHADRWETWADLGAYLLHQCSDGAAARDALRAALDLGADLPVVYIELARAMLSDGATTDEASAIAIELVGRFPDRGDAWLSAGLIYEEIENIKEAEVAYRTALGRADGGMAIVPLANILGKRLDRRGEAEDLLRNAIAETPGRQRCVASRELAELLIHEGDDSGAAEVIKDALRANSRCACCLILNGDVCKRRGELDAAVASYRRALDLHQSEVAALTGLASLVPEAEAAGLIAQAVQLDPDDPRVLLARARLQPMDSEAQIRDASAALALNPDFIESHLFLAGLEAGRANSDLAISHIRSALDHLPSQKELISAFVSTVMAVTTPDNCVQLITVLEGHGNGYIVEPLVVALQMTRGEKPLVAKEIRDVAFDIIVRSRPKHVQDNFGDDS